MYCDFEKNEKIVSNKVLQAAPLFWGHGAISILYHILDKGSTYMHDPIFLVYSKVKVTRVNSKNIVHKFKTNFFFFFFHFQYFIISLLRNSGCFPRGKRAATRVALPIPMVCAWFRWACYLHFWQDSRDLLHAAMRAATWGRENYMKEWAHSFTTGKYPRLSPGSNPR